MFCSNCGTEMNDTFAFCPKCGTRAIKGAGVGSSPFVKNAGISAVLSTIIPGLGQNYNGQIIKGIPFIICAVALMVLAIAMRMPERIAVYAVYGILWIYNIYDAYKSAEKINIK